MIYNRTPDTYFFTLLYLLHYVSLEEGRYQLYGFAVLIIVEHDKSLSFWRKVCEHTSYSLNCCVSVVTCIGHV